MNTSAAAVMNEPIRLPCVPFITRFQTLEFREITGKLRV
jgi:hypothetical protein